LASSGAASRPVRRLRSAASSPLSASDCSGNSLMGLRVAVIGAAGYAGGELLRLLSQHPEVEDFVATSRSQAGMRVGEVQPAPAALSEATFSGATPAEAAAGRDVVFLSLEHGESSRIASEVLNSGVGLVIDLAADFRVQDLSLYQEFYGAHTAPDL